MKKFGVNECWVKLLDNGGLWLAFSLLLVIEKIFWFPKYMFDNGDVIMLQEELLFSWKNNIFDLLKIPNDICSCEAIIYSQSLTSPC